MSNITVNQLPDSNQLDKNDYVIIYNAEGSADNFTYKSRIDDVLNLKTGVVSVNTKTGSTITLISDDLSDSTSSNKFVSQSEKNKIAILRSDLGSNVVLHGDGVYRGVSTSNGNANYTVNTIADRDLLVVSHGDRCLVVDASDDPSVNTGAALYFYSNDSGTWNKIAEYESLDLVLPSGNTVSNGLTKVENVIRLGGNLTGDTKILSAGNTSGIIFDVSGQVLGPESVLIGSGDIINFINPRLYVGVTSLSAGLYRGTSTQNIYAQVDHTGVDLYSSTGSSSVKLLLHPGTGAKFTDGRTVKRGIEYAGNYSSGFNARSLVDAGFVTGTTYLTASQGLTKVGNNIRLGGTLSDTITIAGNSSAGLSLSFDGSIDQFSSIGTGINTYVNDPSTGAFEIISFDGSINNTIPTINFNGPSGKFGIGRFNQDGSHDVYIEALVDGSDIGTLQVVDNRGTKKGLVTSASGYVTDPRSYTDKEYVDDLVDGLVVQTITNGLTTGAPSSDVVFDALALKSPIVTASQGITKVGNDFQFGGTVTTTNTYTVGTTGGGTTSNFRATNATSGSSSNLIFLVGEGGSFQGSSIQIRGSNTVSGRPQVVLSNNAQTLNFESGDVGSTANASVVFTDGRVTKKGIEYAGTGYVTNKRSLTDKDFVTGLTSTLGLSDGNKGDITKSGQTLTINAGINKDWTGTHSFETSKFILWDASKTHRYTFQTGELTTDRIVRIPVITATFDMMLSTGGSTGRIPFVNNNAPAYGHNAGFTFNASTGLAVGSPIIGNGSHTQSGGTTSFKQLLLSPTINSTSTHSGVIYGLDYDPVVTSIASGSTHIAARFASGLIVYSGATQDNSATKVLVLDNQSEIRWRDVSSIGSGGNFWKVSGTTTLTNNVTVGLPSVTGRTFSLEAGSATRGWLRFGNGSSTTQPYFHLKTGTGNELKLDPFDYLGSGGEISLDATVPLRLATSEINTTISGDINVTATNLLVNVEGANIFSPNSINLGVDFNLTPSHYAGIEIDGTANTVNVNSTDSLGTSNISLHGSNGISASGNEIVLQDASTGSITIGGGSIEFGGVSQNNAASKVLALTTGNTVVWKESNSFGSSSFISGLTITQSNPSGVFSTGKEVLCLKSTVVGDDPTVKTFQANGLTTSGGAIGFTHPTVSNTVYFVKAIVVARRTGGSAGTAGDGASYCVVGTFSNNSGTLTQIGSTANLWTHESQAGWNVALVVSGTDIQLNCSGAANNNITWHVVSFEVSPVQA